jgi:phosphomethylpyrimidine synthase
MKITQDVRDYADSLGIDDVDKALDKGLSEKAEEFREMGGDIYSKVN